MNSVPNPLVRTSSGRAPCTSTRRGPPRLGWRFGSVGGCRENFATPGHLRTSGTPWLVEAFFLALVLKTPSTPTHWIHLLSGWYNWNPGEEREFNWGDMIIIFKFKSLFSNDIHSSFAEIFVAILKFNFAMFAIVTCSLSFENFNV